MILTLEEIAKMKETIAKSKQVLEDGLILDPEAAATLHRMIWYYENEIKQSEEKLKNL